MEAEGPGWLVTVQPWYPGWAAWVNGRSVPVEVVDGALVGVPLPAGTHTVILRYTPAGFEQGLLLSLVAVLGTIALWWTWWAGSLVLATERARAWRHRRARSRAGP